MIWTIENTRRLIIDLAHRLQGQAYSGNQKDYRPGQNLKDDLQLESIQVMDLSAQVNAFFHLMETSPDNYLLASYSVDEWAQKCVNGRAQKSESITFLTSGTTGVAQPITHHQSFIDREVAFLKAYFSGTTTIVPLVPSASIYGYLYTIALPKALNIPVVFPSAVHWNNLPPHTLIVGTPFTWSHLLRAMPGHPIRARGVCSTAPLAPPVFQDLLNRGVDMTEVYGATETAGVGLRKNAADPFELFPYWSLQGASTLLDRESGQAYPLMDRVRPTGDNAFVVMNRRDQKLKIAGRLVDLASLESRIQAIKGVQHCQLSAKKQVDRTIITAAVTLQADSPDARQSFLSAVKIYLEPAERPAEVHFVENSP
ncbi:MAG: hypothetical protein RIC19_05895 [Phaeodactylibacter sp.]|uniref:hypothetical protein n=1 Tax=Phaeodactylibacter sp. TaxID=1940289 RepID=UPI0032F0670C